MTTTRNGLVIQNYTTADRITFDLNSQIEANNIIDKS